MLVIGVCETCRDTTHHFSEMETRTEGDLEMLRGLDQAEFIHTNVRYLKCGSFSVDDMDDVNAVTTLHWHHRDKKGRPIASFSGSIDEAL